MKYVQDVIHKDIIMQNIDGKMVESKYPMDSNRTLYIGTKNGIKHLCKA